MSRSRDGTLLTTRSPIFTTPLVMSSSPATIRSAVVLPQPDGPTRTMNSPSPIARDSASTAFVPSGYTLLICSNATPAKPLPSPPVVPNFRAYTGHTVRCERGPDNDQGRAVRGPDLCTDGGIGLNRGPRTPDSEGLCCLPLFEQLLEAGRRFEGGEPRGMEPAVAEPLRDVAAPAGRRDRRRSAQEAAEQEGAGTTALVLSVHG